MKDTYHKTRSYIPRDARASNQESIKLRHKAANNRSVVTWTRRNP